MCCAAPTWPWPPLLLGPMERMCFSCAQLCNPGKELRHFATAGEWFDEMAEVQKNPELPAALSGTWHMEANPCAEELAMLSGSEWDAETLTLRNDHAFVSPIWPVRGDAFGAFELCMKGICQPGVVMTFEDATLARGWVHLTLDPLCCPAKPCCACCPERVCPGASGSGAGHLLLVPDWVWKNSMHVIDGEGEVRERRIWLLPLCCPGPASIAYTLRRVAYADGSKLEPAWSMYLAWRKARTGVDGVAAVGHKWPAPGPGSLRIDRK